MSAEKKMIDDKASEPLSDDTVRDYLKAHTDFFQLHPDMLDYLHISHGSGSAVSLVEKQVSVLRERNMEMRRRLNSLTENARDNDRLYESTRALILKLLDAHSLDDLGRVFNTSMRTDFGVERASIILFGDPATSSDHCRVEAADTARIEIGALLKNRNATSGALRKQELSYLFPGAGDLGSAVVVPLHNGNDLGVIAVGSSDAGHYTSSMGTLFLSHIAEILVRQLPNLDKGVP
jgi:uncharacterized protein YigA (DUF484 family)